MRRTNGQKKTPLEFATHEPLFRQGHVGDLQTKSRIEVIELLERQEKLLANRGFVAQLPDRGAKIERFIASLRSRLQAIENETRELLENSSSSSNASDNLSRDNVPIESDGDPEEVEFILDDGDAIKDSLSIVEKGFSELAIHEGPHYNVVKKASEKKKTSKFMLNRAKTKKGDDKEATAEAAEMVMEKKTSGLLKTQTASTDLSSATLRNPKNTSQLISIEESRALFNKQQAIVKEQQSQLAAQRILSKYAGSSLLETPLNYDNQQLSEEVLVGYGEESEQKEVDEDLDALD